MNFEQSIKNTDLEQYYHVKDGVYLAMKRSWEDCKQEVLKILNDNLISSETRDEKNWYYINESAIEEVEEL